MSSFFVFFLFFSLLMRFEIETTRPGRTGGGLKGNKNHNPPVTGCFANKKRFDYGSSWISTLRDSKPERGAKRGPRSEVFP